MVRKEGKQIPEDDEIVLDHFTWVFDFTFTHNMKKISTGASQQEGVCVGLFQVSSHSLKPCF